MCYVQCHLNSPWAIPPAAQRNSTPCSSPPPWFVWIVLDYIGEFVFSIFISQLVGIWCFFYLGESKLCKPQLSFLINVLPIKLKAWPSCSVRPNLPGMQTAKKTVFLGEDFGKSQPLKCCHASVVFEYLTGCLKHHLYVHRRLSESHALICLWRHFQTHTKMQYLD